MRVSRATKTGTQGAENVFIGELAGHYEIEPEQIALMDEACQLDEDILAGLVNDSEIVSRSKALAAQAGAVGVPIAAVYLSGSVMGLSAAGITSGLATLGLGGVLGLSSMVMGIGTVVVIGVAAYTGLRWMTGGGERHKSAARELLLQEVMRLNQETINNLIEDVSHFAERIVELTREANINRVMIDKLARELTVFSQALGVIGDKGRSLDRVLHAEEE